MPSSPNDKISGREGEGETAVGVATKPSSTKISIEEFKIGTRVQREFDDGKVYVARVMTEPQWVYDEEAKKMSFCRKVKYYADDQEEWADEKNLNDWYFDPHAPKSPPKSPNREEQVSSDDCNWLDENSERENDDDSILSANESINTQPEQTQSISMANATITPPSEISSRLLFQRSKNAEDNQRDPISPDRTESSTPHNSMADDNLSEVTGSSANGSSANTIDENDGRRRSKRARRQTDTFLAASASNAQNSLPTAAAATASANAATNATATARGRKKKSKKNLGIVKQTREDIRQVLIFKMGITEEEIDFALDQMSSPYSQNEAINIIQKRRDERRLTPEDDGVKSNKFNPEIGMRVRVLEGGSTYHGAVTNGPNLLVPEGAKKAVKMWTVTFDDDGEMEDYDWHELFRHRASRPIIKFEGCRGRPLNALELFCGEGIVTQEFCERKYNVKSLDIDPNSYAMMVIDIRKATYEDIGFVPDFIWASPPCTTCTNLAGGHHRNIRKGQFEKTQEAHDHNLLFAQMMYIMNWAKSKNPHLIVVIENPRGQMQYMPMMKEFMDTFDLSQATVDYCAFGRSDKKPTNLWTNDRDLCSRLSYFRCSEGKCPYYNQIHPIGTRSHGQHFNAAAIPKQLAEEVADYIHFKFYRDRIAYTPKITLSAEEENEFNRCMKAGV